MKDDEIYCVKCGKALQIVPDYNVLEDEILPNLLSENPKEQSDALSAPESQSRRSFRRLAALLLIVIAVCAIVKLAFSAHTESEAEETPQADAQDALQEDTQEPEVIYEVEPTFSKAGGEHTDDFELTLSAPDGADVYYEKKEINSANAASGLDLSVEPNEDTVLTDEGEAVDAADRESLSGTLYKEPIPITEGKTIVRAQCVNEDGEKGPIIEKIYVVKYPLPDMPKAIPGSGTYHEETYVTISSNVAGGTIYYTWDGSNPTQNSMLYTEPVLIPEGNHVLSIIVINERGLVSDILRCNYVYLP